MDTNLMFSSESGEWETPKDLFDKLNEFYHFTLDPAATDSNHKCDKYYTIKEDGLAKSWDDNVVFCNPPYGRAVGEWVKKAHESKSTVVMLLPARTDTRWFHQYIYNIADIYFIKGRLKFGGHKNSAPFPSMVVVWNNIKDMKSLEV